MEQISRRAYAKINLGLDVTGKRPDGYHEVRMIMQTVDIYDILTFRKTDRAGLFLFSEQKELPCDRSNLIYRAAEMIRERYQIEEGVEISFLKNIPIAAGMAGGSADAAAVFHGMNELFGLSMSLKEMRGMGVKLGADIPYCIMGGTALSEGIGEILTPLPAPPGAHLVVVKPDISVSTKYVYENLRLKELENHPDIDGMIKALENGNLEGITARLGNVLETVTEREYPVIRSLKELMCREGAEGALMSGSGPTVFGIWQWKEDAQRAARKISEEYPAFRVMTAGFVTDAAAEGEK